VLSILKYHFGVIRGYAFETDGKTLPPMDGEGQVAQVDLELMSQRLRVALGGDTAAIHREFARKALEAATGIPTVVGVRTYLSPAAAEASRVELEDVMRAQGG
jgi:hypothetical protein